MTPIFEISSKLFLSSDIRGCECENQQNHVFCLLRSYTTLWLRGEGGPEEKEGGRAGGQMGNSHSCASERAILLTLSHICYVEIRGGSFCGLAQAQLIDRFTLV